MIKNEELLQRQITEINYLLNTLNHNINYTAITKNVQLLNNDKLEKITFENLAKDKQPNTTIPALKTKIADKFKQPIERHI